jgi:hypothetical protein
MASSNDNIYGIAREATPGVTNATPVFQYLDYISGNDLTYGGSMVTSDAMLRNRELAGAALVNLVGGGSLKAHGRRDTTSEMLIEGAIGGAFASNVAKVGATDFAHTIEKRMLLDAGEAFHQFNGVYVTKWTRSVKAGGNVEDTFDFLIKGRSQRTTKISGATYVPATQGKALTAVDVGQINIGGLTGLYTSLDFSVEQPREAIFVLGSNSAGQINASGSPRKIMTTVKMLRSSIAVDALAGTTGPVSFTLGNGTGNQMTHTMTNCIVNIPTDEIESSALVVSIELMAINDPVVGAGLTLTRS